MLRLIKIICLIVLLTGCAKQPQLIEGRFLNKGQFETGQFILLVPEKILTNNIKQVELYGKVGASVKGKDFYWQKVSEPFNDLNLGRVPATFKINTLWIIE